MEIKASTHTESSQSNSVCNFLEGSTSTLITASRKWRVHKYGSIR